MMRLLTHSDGRRKIMTVSVLRWPGEIFVTVPAPGNAYEFDFSLDIGVSLDNRYKRGESPRQISL